jgi:hypothetical protein
MSVVLVEETRIPGENQDTRRKPGYPEKTKIPGENHAPTCLKSPTNFIT